MAQKFIKQFLKYLLFTDSSKIITVGCEKKYLNYEDTSEVELKRYKVSDYYQKFNQSFTFTKSHYKGLSIIKTYLKSYTKIWIIMFIFQILLTFFITVTPYLNDKIINLIKLKEGWLNLFQILLLLFIQKGLKAVISVHLDYYQYRIGTNLYGQLAMKIFQKAFKTKQDDIRGRVVNLLEEDAYKLINFSYFMLSVIFIPIQLIYAIGLIIWYLGWQFFLVDLYIIILYLIICFFFGALDVKFNSELMKRKDHRIRNTFSYIIQIQRTINKSTIEQNLNQIQYQCIKSRQLQLSQQKKIFALQIISKFTSSMFYTILLSTSLINLHQTQDIALVFTIILLFNQLKYPLIQLPNLISTLSQNYVSICRIEQYLFNKQDQTFDQRIKQSIITLENQQIDLTQKFIKIQVCEQRIKVLKCQQNELSQAICQSLFLQYNKNMMENILFYGQFNDERLTNILNVLELQQLKGQNRKLCNIWELSCLIKYKIMIAKNIYTSNRVLINQKTMNNINKQISETQKISLFQNILKIKHIKLFLPSTFDHKILQIQLTKLNQPKNNVPLYNPININNINYFPQHKQKGLVRIHNYTKYLQISHYAWCFPMFLFFACLAQFLSTFSNIQLKNLTKLKFFQLNFNSPQFYYLYISLIPLVISMSLILFLSINASSNSYKMALQNMKKYTLIYKSSVIINRLANDLKYLDKNFALNALDVTNSLISIIANIVVCLITIASIQKIYSLVIIFIIGCVFSCMFYLNRRFMWARRQCARISGISRSPFLNHFYQIIDGKNMILLHGKLQYVKKQYEQLVNEIVRLYLLGINLQQWFQMRLLFLSLIISCTTAIFTFYLDLNIILTGLILSYTLSLDDLFQNFFRNIVNFEKTSISVQRYFHIINQQ